MFGTKRSQETIDKIRENTLKQFSNDEIDFMVRRMNDSRRNITDKIKQKWYETS